MKYDELSFKTVDENGREHMNDITNVIPNDKNTEEPYVTFTDYSLDENDNFIQKIGRLVEQEGNYYLETSLSKAEEDYVIAQLHDEIVSYVNNVIEESINE